MNPLDSLLRPAVAVRASATCDGCASRLNGMCQPLDTAALDDISSDSERLRAPAKSMVFREGDPALRAFSIVEGVVKLSRLLADGKQQVVGFRFPGDIIGFGTQRTYAFDAELLTAGHFCRIDRRKLDQLLRRYPLMERRLLDLCLQELASTQDHLVTVGRRSAESRVATFLLGLIEVHRRRAMPLAELPMPMTRSDIGDFLGLTLETVSRTFAAFKRQGIIAEPGQHKLRVLNSDALTRIAEGDAA